MDCQKTANIQKVNDEEICSVVPVSNRSLNEGKTRLVQLGRTMENKLLL